MATLLADIDGLFGAENPPSDDTGCLRYVADLLRNCRPVLIILADSGGKLLAADTAGSQADLALGQPVAVELTAHLCENEFHTFEHTANEGPAIAFGLRLSATAEHGILGGLLRMSDEVRRELEAIRPVLADCGSLVWFAFHASRKNSEFRTRIEHLLAEQDVLKVSHSQSIATVIEEREQRIREQRDYVIHLEGEVEKRSAALREAMEQAQHANKAKSEFLANMSHEMRTPMTAILGYADILFEECDTRTTSTHHIEAVETIRRNGRNLLELINDILDLAKVESGKLILEALPCSPVVVVADVLKLLGVRAKEKGLSLRAEYVGLIPETIQTDPTRLRQILMNLVSNAVKFTEEGQIKVAVRLLTPRTWGEASIQFDVIDAGIGLGSLQLTNLFEPFTQADSSMTRRFGGTGLGLALCKRFAVALGGDIAVESRLGEGSKFSVIIPTGSLVGVAMNENPTKEKAAAPQTLPQTRAPAAPLHGRILLAEDGADNQRLIKFILTKAGAEVVVAENGRIAVEKALAESFDVILMDIQMPVLNGHAATRLLRRKGYAKPIIALTAHAMASDRQKCLDAGCDDYATKPIDQDQLLDVLRQHLPPQQTADPAPHQAPAEEPPERGG